MRARRRVESLAALVLVAIVGAAAAQNKPDPGEIHGLKLGLDARRMSADGFGEFACGSNGGPPRQKLDGFVDFARCRAESSGLHEVYLRFDDEEEYIGRAIDDDQYTRKIGTRVAGHPVILSVLFDDGGTLRGIRFVTDPRAAPAERRMAHLLRAAAINRYGPQGWTCVDQRPARRRSAASSSSRRAARPRPSATSRSRRISCASPARARPIRRPANTAPA